MIQIIRDRSYLGAYLVGAYLFCVPAFSYSDSLGLLYIPQVVAAALVAYALLDILKSLRLDIPPEVWLYGLLGLWAVITYFFAANPSEESRNGLQTLIKVVLATLACAQLLKQERDFFIALKMFVFSILLVYYLNIEELRYLTTVGKIVETDRFGGTLNNANTAAILSLTIIWASLLLFLYSKKGLFSGALLIIPTGISLLIIYYSGSKKGLIGLALFALFVARLLYLRQRSSILKKFLVIMIAFALIITVGYYIYTSPFYFRMEQLVSGSSESDSNRYELAREAVNVWLMNLKTFIMGVGHDNFRSYSILQDYSHSTPFELLASNGIVGFSLFTGFMVLLFRKFINLYRKTISQELKGMFFVIVIFLSIYSIFSVGAVLYVSRELLPLLGCLGAFGQYYLNRLKQNQLKEVAASAV